MNDFMSMNRQLSEDEMEAIVFRQQFDRDARLKRTWLSQQVKDTNAKAAATIPFQQRQGPPTTSPEQKLQLKDLEKKSRFPAIPRFKPQAQSTSVPEEMSRFDQGFSRATTEVRNKIFSDLDEYINALYMKRMGMKDEDDMRDEIADDDADADDYDAPDLGAPDDSAMDASTL
ncbi:uncharacterized protein LOC121388877 [Gigantopelta aegis]|uniref:uncharacterized protein LOC121388877 n=1 Tax=Gigantopelta aegis TaxID=1735272 RepID=UPI001B88A28A|nr:uncharacterized protein LOC121388877 [Gigantopelta aegis]